MAARLFEVQVIVERITPDIAIVVYSNRRYIISARDLRYENNQAFVLIEHLTIYNLYQ